MGTRIEKHNMSNQHTPNVVITSNGQNMQLGRYIQIPISKNFNGRTGAPIARSMSQNTITMMPVSAQKIYRISPSRSISPATDGLPVGSLVTSKPEAVQIQVSDSIDSSEKLKRKQVFPAIETRLEKSVEKVKAIKVTDGPPVVKRIRNNKEYDNYSPSTFKPGPKPSVDDHLLDERALDRRNRRRASNRQAARKQRDKRLQKMQEYEDMIAEVKSQRDEAQRKVIELSDILDKVIKAYPETKAIINQDEANDDTPLQSLELRKGREQTVEFYVAKAEIHEDDYSQTTIDQTDDDVPIGDVVKIEQFE